MTDAGTFASKKFRRKTPGDFFAQNKQLEDELKIKCFFSCWPWAGDKVSTNVYAEATQGVLDWLREIKRSPPSPVI